MVGDETKTLTDGKHTLSDHTCSDLCSHDWAPFFLENLCDWSTPL